MINNIERLKSEILRRRIAKEEELVGCCEQDIDAIEKQYGKLPLAYKQIMRLWGGGVEKGLSVYEDNFRLTRAVSLTRWMEEFIFLRDEDNRAVTSELKNVFFISGRYAEYGGGAQFIKTGENSVDAVVYCIDMALCDDIDEWISSIEVAFDSIWAWIEIVLDEKEEQLLRSGKLIQKVEGENNKSFWSNLFDKQ